ncbi:MAG: hypothetical protein WC975_02345 [Phycisphaerae bacterium]
MTTDPHSKKEALKEVRYETTVPDTLDLAERAEYAINAMTGMLDEKRDYEYMWWVSFAPLSVVYHPATWFDSNPRAGWGLALMRTMTGSDYKFDTEQAMFESLKSRTGEDGLLYNAPYREDAIWRGGGRGTERTTKWRKDEEVSGVGGSAVYLLMLLAKYEKEGDPAILEMARKTANTLIKIAIHKDDYAYYPMTCDAGLECAYFKKSGWSDTKEAGSETDSPEGTVLAYMGIFVHALCRWYELIRDEKALELARKLVKYMLKPEFWIGNLDSWAKGFNQDLVSGHGGLQRKPAALFKGHQSGMVYAFQGLIEYGIAAGDTYVKEWVRQAYEYMRNLGLARLGMWGENIANNMMPMIAIKLCDAGLGDYWEDVDQYVRNAMVEDQFIDAEALKKLSRDRGYPTEVKSKTIDRYLNFPPPCTLEKPITLENLSIDRFLGSLRWAGMCDRKGTLDPTQNGVAAAGPYLEPFYFIWESIVRCKDNSAQINLLLNRASPWLDVDSYLPYEGKVVIRNKTAKNISIRIPCWVDRGKITCKVHGEKASFFWVGNYMSLAGLKGTEVITIEFPMVETQETYYLTSWTLEEPWYRVKDALPKYILHFKGNTCVKAEFPNREKFVEGFLMLNAENVTGYPVYQREHYRQNKAPMKTVSRYVAPKLVNW